MASLEHDAACEGLDQSIFFSVWGEDHAKSICADCPARVPCLEYALRTGQEFGVWGGLTTQERYNLLRRARPGGPPLLEITYTTRARSTGSLCSAGRTAEGWGVTCHTHGDTSARARDRAAAEYAVSRPQEWCTRCAG